MATTTRRGSWRQVAPGTYGKNIGTYGAVKFGATARVSFVPFPTCEILDANGVHVAIPTPADAKKYIAAAKKVYTKDVAAEATRVQKRSTTRPAPDATLPKWKPPSYSAPPGGHKGRSLVSRPGTLPGIHTSIRELQAEADKLEYTASIPGAKSAAYKKRATKLRARIEKLRG